MSALPVYRAWHKERRMMYQVVAFNLQAQSVAVTYGDGFGWHVCSPDEIELMQSTGWHDRLKQEIWESDIVKIGDWYGVVVWDVVTDGWRIAVGYTYNLRDHDMIVVGNIWENPELYRPDATQDVRG